MRTPKSIITAALALAMSASTTFAQGGKDAFPFIRNDRNPVNAGMSFAGSASTSTVAYSSFGNASVIPFSPATLDLGVNYQSWAPDGVKSGNIAAGAAYRIGENLGIAAGFAMQSGERYYFDDFETGKSSSYTPKDMVINGGVAYKVADDWSVGLNLRYASQDLGRGAFYETFGGDLLVYYRATDKVALTGGIKGLGSSIKDDAGKSFNPPASAHLAGEYAAVLEDVHGLRADLDLDCFFSGKFTAAVGVEYGFKDMLFVRAGYHLGAEEAVLPSFASFGAGVKFAGLRIDAAYLTANEVLGNTVTIGLGYSF